MKSLALVVLAAAALRGAEPDALAIHERIRDRHMPYSTVMDPVFASADSEEITGYTRCGDSAIWTGHYLAAESYRWSVTRSPEAKANIMEALNGIRKLVDVTGTDVLARCAVPIDSPWASGIISEESPHGIRIGSVNGQGYYWVGNTSRDQYSGVFFGLTVTWNLVDDQLVHDWVSMLATRMLDRLLEDHWLVRMPEGEITTSFIGRPDQQLSLLKLGRRLNPKRFENSYKVLANSAAQTVIIPIFVESRDPYGSYFKFNLAHINLYNLLTSGDNSWIRRGYVNAFDVVRHATEDHQNAFFDMIDTAVNGNNAARDQRVRDNLEAWLQRPSRDFWKDLRPVYPASLDDENRAWLVIPVVERTPTDFLWQRSPYQLYGGLYGQIESAGIDYILPYWMARYHHVVSE
ncbi:MAG: hypothetical protein HZB13_19270 [Acidobacteria bacterium]|nr:hypothetical protein [Acidobacteriota bacterium]